MEPTHDMEFLPQDAAEWVVSYSCVGWTISSVGSEASLCINEVQAVDAIGAIRRALAGKRGLALI